MIMRAWRGCLSGESIVTVEIAIGCCVLAAALGTVTFFFLWSRRTIGRIAAKGPGTAREVAQELNGDD